MATVQYVVRDGGGNIYGPATAGMLREWIGEGRLTAAMEVAEEGTTRFVAAGGIPQLQEAFGKGTQGTAGGAATAEVGGAAVVTTRTAGSVSRMGGGGGVAGVGGGVAGSAGSAMTGPQGVGAGYDPGYQSYLSGQANHPLAVTSLILGLVGIPALVFCPVSLVAEILAVVFGHIARGQIRREPERYGGAGMATAGMIIGYCMLGLLVLGVVAYIVFIVFVVAAGAAAGPGGGPARPF